MNWTTEMDMHYAVRGHKWKLKVNRCRLQNDETVLLQSESYPLMDQATGVAFVLDVSPVNSFKKRHDDWAI